MKINIGGIDIELDDKVAQTVKSAHDAAIKASNESATAATKRATDAETALAAQGEAMKKAASDHKTALDAAQAQVLKPEQVAAMVSELSVVATDAKSVLPELDTAGKTAAAIRTEVLAGVLAEDGQLKTLVTKMLGGSEPAKASDVLVRAAFDAVVSIGGTTTDAGDEAEIVGAFTGDKKNGVNAKTQKLSGRALMIARSRGQVGRDAERQ